MITDEMTVWMTKHVAALPPTHSYVAIFDWVSLGRYAGFGASAWCQTLQHVYKRITAWPTQPPEAFTQEDFEFFRDGEIPIPDITTYPITLVTSVQIRW